MLRACISCGAVIRAPLARCLGCRRAWEARRGTRTQRGYGSTWARTSKAVLERDGWACHWCGAPATTADHVLPKVRGGSDDPSNLVASCVSCNSSRGGRGGAPTA